MLNEVIIYILVGAAEESFVNLRLLKMGLIQKGVNLNETIDVAIKSL